MLIEKALIRSKIDTTEIEIFLSSLLGKDRSFVRGFPDFKLTPNHTRKLKEFIKRRAKSEPLAYIIGFKEFCGLKFFVDKRVMVPRPETESLVNEVISHVYATPNRNRKNHWPYEDLTIVDVGTGSGCIAISLAKAIPFARVAAVEKDKSAFQVARKNIRSHKVRKQVDLILGELLDPIGKPVDIIVANLPYIPTSRFKKLQKEVTKWEPRIALDGGSDGLKFYRKLFAQVADKLKPNGLFVYEIDGEIYSKRY